MTAPTHQEWSCTRKVRHATELVASGEAKRILDQTGRVLDWYECGYCQGWHLTTDRNAPRLKPKSVHRPQEAVRNQIYRARRLAAPYKPRNGRSRAP